MSLQHEFYIVNDSQNYYNITSSNNKVELDDAIILYILDTFDWIKTYNPSKNTDGYGLNYHGQTIMKNESLDILKQILNAWIGIFDIAPESFSLRGLYTEDENGVGGYEKKKVSRQEILLQLNSLLSLTCEALDKATYILHAGI